MVYGRNLMSIVLALIARYRPSVCCFGQIAKVRVAMVCSPNYGFSMSSIFIINSTKVLLCPQITANIKFVLVYLFV